MSAGAKQYVSVECHCGKTVGGTLDRYDKARCNHCGKMWWALQPRREARLKLFLWPGPNLTREQMKEMPQ